MTTLHFRPITRRGIQIALGLLWLLDGVLQLQHQMFTSSFAYNVITPAAQGQPRLVTTPMHLAIRLVLTHPAIFNTVFALVQLCIGAFLLWKRTVRLALIASVLWAANVWFLGEGFGGILSLHTSLLAGAPGAALLYGILALAVMPKSNKNKKEKDLKTREQPAVWLVIVWATVWLFGALYQLLPGQNSVSNVSAMISGNVAGAPSWLAAIDTHAARFVYNFGSPHAQIYIPTQMYMSGGQMAIMSNQTGSSSGAWLIVLLVIIQALIGIAVFLPGIGRRLAITAGIVLSLCFWVVGQSLGEYYTGIATDPNTAPLFILLGVAVLACAPYSFRQLNQQITRIFDRLETILT